MEQETLRTRIEEVVAELPNGIHIPSGIELFDDYEGGVIATCRVEKRGQASQWNWRSASALSRTDFPLKVVVWGDDGSVAKFWVRRLSWSQAAA